MASKSLELNGWNTLQTFLWEGSFCALTLTHNYAFFELIPSKCVFHVIYLFQYRLQWKDRLLLMFMQQPTNMKVSLKSRNHFELILIIFHIKFHPLWCQHVCKYLSMLVRVYLFICKKTRLLEQFCMHHRIKLYISSFLCFIVL